MACCILWAIFGSIFSRVWEARFILATGIRSLSAKPAVSKAELLTELTTVIAQAIQVITKLQAEDLERTYVIQGMAYSGAADIIAVVEHLSYHVGQIVFAVKLLKHVDLGLTKGIDLNQQNPLAS